MRFATASSPGRRCSTSTPLRSSSSSSALLIRPRPPTQLREAARKALPRVRLVTRLASRIEATFGSPGNCWEGGVRGGSATRTGRAGEPLCRYAEGAGRGQALWGPEQAALAEAGALAGACLLQPSGDELDVRLQRVQLRQPPLGDGTQPLH